MALSDAWDYVFIPLMDIKFIAAIFFFPPPIPDWDWDSDWQWYNSDSLVWQAILPDH